VATSLYGSYIGNICLYRLYHGNGIVENGGCARWRRWRAAYLVWPVWRESEVIISR